MQLIHTTLRVRHWQLVIPLVSLRRIAAAVVWSQNLVQAPTHAVVGEDAVCHLPPQQLNSSALCDDPMQQLARSSESMRPQSSPRACS